VTTRIAAARTLVRTTGTYVGAGQLGQFFEILVMETIMNRHVMVIALAASTFACVPKDKYAAAIADGQSTHTALAASLDREKADQAQLADLHKQLDAAQAQIADQAAKLSGLTTDKQNLQAQLDLETAIDSQLRNELARLGKNVDQMLQDKGTLSKQLDDAKGRLDELRKAQAESAAQTALYQQFVQKFRAMIEAGQLKITMRKGRLVLELPNDVLFDSGQTALKPAGRAAVVEVGAVLRACRTGTFRSPATPTTCPFRLQPSRPTGSFRPRAR
jgi:chemotaxis protein MotB